MADPVSSSNQVLKLTCILFLLALAFFVAARIYATWEAHEMVAALGPAMVMLMACATLVVFLVLAIMLRPQLPMITPHSKPKQRRRNRLSSDWCRRSSTRELSGSTGTCSEGDTRVTESQKGEEEHDDLHVGPISVFPMVRIQQTVVTTNAIKTHGH